MLCGDTKEIMRKNSEKGRKFRLLGRNRAEDETPRILFKDAAALYIEFSKAATAAETAIKRMRFFVQFFLPWHARLDPLVRVFRDRYHLAFLLVIYLSRLSPPFPRPRRIPTALAPPPAHSLFATPAAILLSPHCSPFRSTHFLLPLPSPFAAVRTWEISSSLAPVTDRIRPPHSLKVPQQRFEEKAHYKYHKQNADHDPLL